MRVVNDDVELELESAPDDVGVHRNASPEHGLQRWTVNR